MATLQESAIYEESIFQLEKSTPPLGGAPVFTGSTPTAGHANAQAAQLANRTSWLKQQIDNNGSASSLSSDLSNSTDSSKGANLVGYDGTQIDKILNLDRPITSYADLRAYTGKATVVNLIDSFRTGRFRKIAEIQGGYVDDSGITIVASNGWVWQRINIGEVHVDWYLSPDWVQGVTDDTYAFQRACGYRTRQGGGTVRFFRRHLIDSNLYVNDYVHLKGALENAEELLDGKQAYSSKASTLIINPTKTVYLESGASLSHSLLIPKGMALRFPDEAAAIAGVASFAGTAVTARGAGVYFHDSTVWGFNQAFYSKSLERARVERIKGDCTNGIHIEACYDIADVSNCHFWPWLTAHRGFTNTVSLRAGAAYRFANVGDWNRLSRNFSYGYNRGFAIDSCDNVELINCGADWVGALNNTTSIGFEITGTSRNTVLMACQAAAQWRGVYINTSAGSGQMVQMVGCQFWDNDDCHVKLSQGYLQASGNAYRGAPRGIDVDSTSLGATITDNRFESQSVLPVSGIMTLVTASGNTYIGCTDTIMGIRDVSTAQISTKVDTLYNTPGGRTHATRRAGGSSSAPTALADGAIIFNQQALAHNGTSFNITSGMRMQTRGNQSEASAGGAIILSTCPINSITPLDRWVFESNGSLIPVGNATQDLAGPANRINNSYFAVAPSVGSDARYKTKPKDIPDKVLDAWESVSYKSYQLLEAIQQKGKKEARLHFGVIAQQVVEAFTSQGLDATDYGLLCHDSWEAEDAVDEVLDEQGNVIVPAKEAIEAADRYSIRYEEALVLECALQRRATKRLEERLLALEKLNASNQ